jgi:chromosome segregation ATPase
MDFDLAQFKTKIDIFDNDMTNMTNSMDHFKLVISDNETRITHHQREIIGMKQACMELANNTARQTSLLETIDKTKVMCNQFNRAAEDLRNQLDTTDIYIENYLPFRIMKEIGTLLTECFD